MKIMPAEIRATVPLYLDGKIQQWFTRGDGKGVIFLLNCKDVEEARALMESLPLSKENLVDEQFIPVGPLLPLGILLRNSPANKGTRLTNQGLLARSQTAIVVNLVALYKPLDGSWQSFPLEATPRMNSPPTA